MRFTKETKISIFAAALMTGIGSALLVSNLTNMANYVWIFFAGFTICTGSIKGIKAFPNVICSL